MRMMPGGQRRPKRFLKRQARTIFRRADKGEPIIDRVTRIQANLEHPYCGTIRLKFTKTGGPERDATPQNSRVSALFFRNALRFPAFHCENDRPKEIPRRFFREISVQFAVLKTWQRKPNQGLIRGKRKIRSLS